MAPKVMLDQQEIGLAVLDRQNLYRLIAQMRVLRTIVLRIVC
jgi:hypothetical protein